MTARPISSAASSAARYGVLPILIWRTMFSISTMASSTRMPTTSVMPSRLTRFSEKPIMSIAQKVGMTDSGSAIAETSVARMSRRKISTTITDRAGAFEQRLHRRIVVAFGVVDRVVDLADRDVGMRCLQLGDRRLDAPVDVDVALALAAEDAERHDGLVVDAGEGLRLLPGVGDGGDLRQRDAAAAAQRDFQLLQVGERLGAAQRADRLVAAAEIGAAAGQVDIGRAQRAVDVAGGDAERVQPVGVELDLDLARHAAIAVDAGDALQALQLADDGVVDEPGQLLDASWPAPRRHRSGSPGPRRRRG